ncbi:hypothetical protein F5B20DRAFT_541305 [Whalleya microplaca]|nr:hypothetical protein F5B20DRAFT_541305 [Whalleya microplaca]
MSDRPKPHLLNLPAEIREQIYRALLAPGANQRTRVEDYAAYTYYDYRAALVLFRLCRQLYYESRKVFRDLNVFVRVETPWPEAQNHVAFHGHVPILVKGARAAHFGAHSLAVVIDSPHMPMEAGERRYFVILVDDLPKFTKVWFYSDLTNPGLNGLLELTLRLRDPCAPAGAEKHIAEKRQRDLLLPFGMLKGLRQALITGDVPASPPIETQMRAAMAIPYDTPEHCLSETTRLKALGNEALTAGDYRGALRIYEQAWAAMHIVVRGRQRHMHGEGFFARDLTLPPWEGKNGQAERLSLRVQLVANTCLAYLRLEDWDELRFWGMRTINMMRQALGVGVAGPGVGVEMGAEAGDGYDIPPENEAVLSFPAAVQMGKIYYRTAVAFRELGDKGTARKLLRVASIYLPRDESVRKEVAACALRIG